MYIYVAYSHSELYLNHGCCSLYTVSLHDLRISQSLKERGLEEGVTFTRNMAKAHNFLRTLLVGKRTASETWHNSLSFG
jgi:hypothetical protein